MSFRTLKIITAFTTVAGFLAVMWVVAPVDGRFGMEPQNVAALAILGYLTLVGITWGAYLHRDAEIAHAEAEAYQERYYS